MEIYFIYIFESIFTGTIKASFYLIRYSVPAQLQHWSYVKIAFLRGRNARECNAELREALGDKALPYRSVARWEEAFKRERIGTVDLSRSLLTQRCKWLFIKHCLTDERRWIVSKLSAHSGISASKVKEGLKDAQALCKMGATCVGWGTKMDSIRDMLNQSGEIPTLRKSFLQYNWRRTLRSKRPAILNNAIILLDNAQATLQLVFKTSCSGGRGRSCNTLRTPLTKVHATLISFRNWRRLAASTEAVCKQGWHLNSVSKRGGAHTRITHSWSIQRLPRRW